MQPQHANLIRGLSIAVIALSAFALCASLLGAIMIGVGNQAINAYLYSNTSQNTQNQGSSRYFDSSSHSSHHSYYDDIHDSYDPDDYYGELHNYGDDYDGGDELSGVFPHDGRSSQRDATVVLLHGMIGLLVVGMVITVIARIVTLIAGIICLRSAKNLSQYGQVFGWSIAGAIVSLISLSVVSLILFIVMTVFSSQDRKQPGGTPPTGATTTNPAPTVGPAPAPNSPQNSTQPMSSNGQGEADTVLIFGTPVTSADQPLDAGVTSENQIQSVNSVNQGQPATQGYLVETLTFEETVSETSDTPADNLSDTPAERAGSDS